MIERDETMRKDWTRLRGVSLLPLLTHLWARTHKDEYRYTITTLCSGTSPITVALVRARTVHRKREKGELNDLTSDELRGETNAKTHTRTRYTELVVE